MKARIFIWVLNLFLFGPINGQKKIDKSYLSKDLDVLKVNLETYHTGLYTYTSKKEFDDWFVKTKSSLDDISAQEFFGKINELNALIKNGHTFFHLNAAQRDKDLKMPCFSIYKFKDSFYIKSVRSKPYENIVGKQLLSLNGVSINKVFDHLLKYKKRDGSNTTQPVEELLHSFPNIYALEYGANDYTTIEIYDKTDPKEVRLLNIPFQISESKTDMNYEKGGIEYNIENNIGYLNIPTFYLKPLKKERYASKLKKFFGEIQNQRIEHLIIDVRNNGGGNTEAVEELISYLYDQKFTFYQDVYQRHRKWDTTIIPEINHTPKGTPGWALKKGDDGLYRAISGTSGMRQASPKNKTYKGKLYILIHGNSLSAAAEFASFIKQYRAATFIGEEAGGNKVQNTSGIALQIGLPNSKIIAEIPIILWKMNVNFENDAHGVTPDHWVRNSIQEEIDHIDSVLTFTYGLIKKIHGSP